MQTKSAGAGLVCNPSFIPFHLKYKLHLNHNHKIKLYPSSQNLVPWHFQQLDELKPLGVGSRHVPGSCPRRPQRWCGTRPPRTGWPWRRSRTEASWRRSTCWWLVTSSKRSGGKVALSLGLKLLFRHPSFCWFKVFKLPRDENHSATTIFHFHGVRLDAWTPWLTTRQPAIFGIKLCHLTLCLS